MEQEGNKDLDPISGLPPGESTPDPVTVTPNQASPSDEGIQEAHAAQEAYLSRNRYNDPDYQQAAQQALRNYELSPETYRNMFPNDSETLGRMQSWGELAGQNYVGRIGIQKETSDKNPEESNLIDDSNPLPKVRNPLTPVNINTLGVNSSQLDIAQEHVSQLNKSLLVSLIIILALSICSIYLINDNRKLNFSLESLRLEKESSRRINRYIHKDLTDALAKIKELENAKSK